MRKLSLILLCALAATAKAASFEFADHVHTAQSAYAERRLDEALRPVIERTRKDARFTFSIDIDARLGAEAFVVETRGQAISIKGGDARGLIYGALAAREQVRNGVALTKLHATGRTPKQEFRGIKFNTPWDSYRPSSALDQHYDTARDLHFWEAFLDMMVENRFNTISLWTLHPFTYMIRPRHFPEASPWSDEEFARWQHLYREIFRMAKERGLDTYVVFWSIFVSQEFARAHDVAKENFYPHYFGAGDTSEITKRYLRESVTQMLEEYPDLDGIGVSHGEGMGGMTPAERQGFVDDVYIAGALAAHRDPPVKLIHRVPFSSGLSSGPGVSTDTEQITRSAMERLDHRFSGPIWVEMKFNWSHGHSTPRLVKVHGGKLGDTYFNPPPSNYKIVWQVRNEDFFALRWGVPAFIRAHIAMNGSADYVGGYFIGSETYIPALDYFTAIADPVDWKWAFQRQWLFYELWGRLLYDPATPDSVFEADFVRRYGPAAKPLLGAYALASSTQLRLASLYDSTWDFTLYGEGFLALQGATTRYIGVDALIRRPVMDPSYVSVADFVEAVVAGRRFPAGRMTPDRLATLLERDCRRALREVAPIDTRGNASLRYEVADVETWSHLGLHLAEKLRGAIALERFRRLGDARDQASAIRHLTAALGEWDEVIRITRPLYRDMKLTHYNGNAFSANPHNLFHWALVRHEVAQDIDVARQAHLESAKSSN